MDQALNDFHIILPSNASMDVFPGNTPDRYITKLAHPVSLGGSWECCLAEATIPGRFFTIQENYNDEYMIKRIVFVKQITTLPQLKVPLKNTEFDDFIDGFNATLRNMWHDSDAPVVLSRRNKTMKVIVKSGWSISTGSKQFLTIINRKQNWYKYENKHNVDVFSMEQYNPPDMSSLTESIVIKALKPIEDTVYEIEVNEENDLFEEINQRIEKVLGYNKVLIFEENSEIVITKKDEIEIELNKIKCPKLMTTLNLNTNLHRIHEKKSTFTYHKQSTKIKSEKIRIIMYKLFTNINTKEEMKIFKIPSGMYQTPKELFEEFKHVYLKVLSNKKVKLTVPVDVAISIGKKLSEMLGFMKQDFITGEYISDYNLELKAGIDEIYVYTDIISPSLVGNTLSSILKVIPIANEKNEQIVKHFSTPLYFSVKKNHFDVIEIQMRSSAGIPIKFLSGKSNLVLSFRRKLI